MLRRLAIAGFVLLFSSILLGSGFALAEAFRAPHPQDQPISVIGTDSFLEMRATMGTVTEYRPAPDTYCYEWKDGKACFKVAPNTGVPRVSEAQ